MASRVSLSEKFYTFARMKRAKRKYRLTLEECSHLREVKTITLTMPRLLIGASVVAAVFLLMLVLLLYASPLGKSEADSTTDNELHALYMRLDSLQSLADVNEKFISNIREVLDVDRQPSDSLRAGVLLKSLPVDSLMTGSPAERRFVASMGEREKYNLQVLSPVAADGMIFSNPVEGGIVAEESAKSFLVRMIVPVGSGVCAVADGIVVDSYSSGASGKYNLIIQHPNGFVSRYTNVGTPLVDNGATVFSGQAITAPANSRGSLTSGDLIGVELWHDGTPLYPADYIYRLNR